MNNIIEIDDRVLFYYGADHSLFSKLYIKYNVRRAHFINHRCVMRGIYESTSRYVTYISQTPIRCTYHECNGLSNCFSTDEIEYENKLKEFMIYNSTKYNLILRISELLPELLIIIQREFFYVLTNII